MYNGATHLSLAIQSILNQTFDDFEFIIADDASQDNSVSVIESFNDPRIKLIRNHKNLGLRRTLNKLIDHSLGMYIARMDQDDISFPDRFEKQNSFLDVNRNIDICGSWVKTISDQNIGNTWSYPPTDHSTIISRLFFGTCIIHPTVFMRRESIDLNDLRYDDEYEHAEDYDFWVRASEKLYLANIPEPLLYYRIGNQKVDRYKSTQNRTADRIRTNLRTRLIGDSRYHDTHNALFYGGETLNLVSCKEIDGFIHTLRFNNNRKNLYPLESFENILNEKWQLMLGREPSNFKRIQLIIGSKYLPIQAKLSYLKNIIKTL